MLRWMLNGKVVYDDGFTLNKHGDVLIFKMTEKVYTTTRVQWKIKVTHSRVAVGSLNCRAQYSTGKIFNVQSVFHATFYLLKIRVSETFSI